MQMELYLNLYKLVYCMRAHVSMLLVFVVSHPKFWFKENMSNKAIKSKHRFASPHILV